MDVATVTGARTEPTREVRLDPPAVAMVWSGRGRAHEPITVPEVRLQDGEVLARVELATVCGSDIHTVAGDRPATVPLVLGHEYVGRVIAVAGHPHAADGTELCPGDRVVWSVMACCTACDRCRAGIPQKCRALLKYGHQRIGTGWQLTGGFASHVHLRAGTTIVRVHESLPAEVLVPGSCGTATACAAVDRAARVLDLDGAVVLVTGAGLIGLTATALATERGARVIVADPDPARRELAARFGAVAAVDPGDLDASPRVRAELGTAEIDVVIEASGSRAAIDAGLGVLGVGGVLVLVGSVFPAGTVAVDPERVVRSLHTICGVHNYAPRHLVEAVEFLHTHAARYPFAELVAEQFSLLDLDQALAVAAESGAVRVAVAP